MSFQKIMESPFIRPSNNIKERELVVSVDIGSTETRCIVRNPATNIQSEVLAVDTGEIIIPRKLEVVYTEPDIKYNLEAIISSNSVNVHIIKGDMRSYYNKPQKVLASCASKLDQEQTYNSITFIIALAILLYSVEHDESAETTNINLMLSLPSEDVGSDARREKAQSRLINKFSVEFPRFAYTVNYEIKMLKLYSEVYAAATAYAVQRGISPKDRYVFVDCGGRNRGAIIYTNGRLTSEASITSNGGGDVYIKELSKIIQNRTDISNPNKYAVIRSLGTGFIANGSVSIDISECLDEAKEMLSEYLLETVLSAVDYNDLQLNEIHTIVCTGRTMMPSVYNGHTTSPSVVSKLEHKIKEICPTVNVVYYDTPNPVVKGLTYLSLKFSR